jgi:hypothetical protein
MSHEGLEEQWEATCKVFDSLFIRDTEFRKNGVVMLPPKRHFFLVNNLRNQYRGIEEIYRRQAS